MSSVHYDVVVIGGGVSGISALIWCKQLGLQALLIEKKARLGGQLNYVYNKLKDYPGFSEHTGVTLARKLEREVNHLRESILFETEVTELKPLENEVIIHGFSNHSVNGEIGFQIRSTFVIIAIGVEDRKLKIPGEERLRPLSTSKDYHLFQDKDVLIVGGGDRAFEGACRVQKQANRITLIHRHDRFKARNEYVEQVLQSTRVRVQTFSILEEIQWKSSSKKAIIKNLKTNQKQELEVDYILIRIGISPDLSFLKDIVTCTNTHVKVDSYGRTSCPLIYAVGDITNVASYSSISKCVGEAMIAAKNIWMRLHH